MAGLGIGVVIVLYLSQRSKAKIDNFNDDMEYRLEAINLISNRKHFYFFTDPDIIDLFSSVTDLRKFGLSIYDGTLKNIDLLLKLKYQAAEGLKNCKYNLDVAKELRNKILNNWASLGYSINNQQLLSKHTESLKTLKIILNKHINDIVDICNKVGATEYISGLGGKSYLNESLFKILLLSKEADSPLLDELEISGL